ARFEPVHVLAGGESILSQARDLVGQVPNVTIHDVLTNDAWMRDHGPTFLVGPPGSAPALVDWDFNSWGGKYLPFDDDNAVPRFVAAHVEQHRYTPGIVLEGGAIDVNGTGSLLTSEQCLLNPNRNPTLSREQIEQYLCDYTAARNVIWLGEGIVGDDTDGHVDELARFVGPGTIVAAVEPDPTDVNYAALQDNLARLVAARDEHGQPFEVIPLPLPGPVVINGVRMPASYCNFYVANGVVIVPEFGDPQDRVAQEIIGKFFPSRQVIGLGARDLIWGRGAFHCITQQQPRTV
ncbi:MAG: agmatine deiminase family protein, partial [Planctomycetaceae bacterium]|nr:agmatine deiminase family protein [Planctomycetaceae bacterium]